MKKLCVRLAVLPLFLAAACVGATKSETPLSPAIAGPIPGVGISAPSVVAPPVDALVDTNTQPITSGRKRRDQRCSTPSYWFEIASDPNSRILFAKEGIPQDASGRTSDPGCAVTEREVFLACLELRTAPMGAFGATSVCIFTPIVFGAPTLISPINNALTSTAQLTVVIGNASHRARSGGLLPYRDRHPAAFDPVLVR